MIIGIERLLFIEESTDDLAGHIINGEMRMCDLITKPGEGRGVHLNEYVKISAAGPVGMNLGSVQQLKFVDCFFDGLF